MYDTTLRAVKQTNPSAALVKYVIISDTEKQNKKELGTRRKEGRGGEVVELRNRQIIDTLDDDDVRDIKYKKEPEIYNENKKIKKNPNS